jgi:hypothetical protein
MAIEDKLRFQMETQQYSATQAAMNPSLGQVPHYNYQVQDHGVHYSDPYGDPYGQNQFHQA